jgi:hypothetical protein
MIRPEQSVFWHFFYMEKQVGELSFNSSRPLLTLKNNAVAWCNMMPYLDWLFFSAIVEALL